MYRRNSTRAVFFVVSCRQSNGGEGIELPEPTFASISKRTWYLKKDSPDFFGVHNNFRISFEQELGHRCIIELKHILSTPMKKM